MVAPLWSIPFICRRTIDSELRFVIPTTGDVLILITNECSSLFDFLHPFGSLISSSSHCRCQTIIKIRDCVSFSYWSLSLSLSLVHPPFFLRHWFLYRDVIIKSNIWYFDCWSYPPSSVNRRSKQTISRFTTSEPNSKSYTLRHKHTHTHNRTGNRTCYILMMSWHMGGVMFSVVNCRSRSRHAFFFFLPLFHLVVLPLIRRLKAIEGSTHRAS